MKTRIKLIQSLTKFTFLETLTLLRMGRFGAVHGFRGTKKSHPLFKIYHTYATIMKLWHICNLPKEDPKNINHVTHPVSSADISIFSSEISKFCYIKKYKYRLHFDG